MIDRSSNTATNQLIDYLGSDYINQFLENRGYQVTRVNFKLMGEKIMPSNPGSVPNRLTANELTEMMVQIYNGETPGAKLLVETLNRQSDQVWDLPPCKELKLSGWAKKPVENSLVLGTTLAMNIDGEAYVMTVIDSRSSGDLQIRNLFLRLPITLVKIPVFNQSGARFTKIQFGSSINPRRC